MASKILLKKSTTASTVPTTLDLEVGEVAINTEDKRLFTKDSGGSIVEVSTTPSTLDVDGNTTVGGTLGVTGNTTVGGTLGVTGTTTLGTANIDTATVTTALSVPTPTLDAHAATKGYVDTEVSSAVATVIDSSPAALDTLNELAAALGDDPNFSATITTTIGTKLPKDGSEAMSGNLDLGSNHIINVSDPSNVGDAANKNYVDTQDALKLSLTGGTMSGAIAMGTNKITGLGTPTTTTDAVTKAYVDSFVSGITDLDQAVTDAEAAQAAAEAAQTAAETAETNAETAQTAAETAQANAEAVYDNFDDRYLGVKVTAPALDNDGDPLVAGALYFDSVVGAMYVYDGSTWSTVAPVATSVTVSQISDLTATAAELNKLDGVTATTAEINYLDGVTSNIQTQIDNIDVDPTKGSLTKTFTNGETASITLSGALSPAPVVSVTKEVAQTGVSSKGGWDVATDGSNYELHDTAYDTTLTPGSTPSVDGASYDSVSFSVSSFATEPDGFCFSPDGTVMLVAANEDDDIIQYSLSTGFDVSTASYARQYNYTTSNNITDVGFNDDGTKMFVLDTGSRLIASLPLTTPYDIGAVGSSSTFSLTDMTAPNGFQFNADGTKLFAVDNSTNTVYQYSLSTAYDITTMSYDSISLTVSSQDSSHTGIEFNSTGTKMFLVGSQNDSVYQYTLSTGFDLSTASYDSVSFSVNSQETAPHGVRFNSDFSKMYILGRTSDTVYQYSMGADDALILGSGSFASTDVGKRIVGNGGEAILTATDGSYSLVTAFTDSSTIASGSWSMFALTFDGTDGVELTGVVNGFDIANASYDSVSFSVSAVETNPSGLTFNNDGTRMYIIGTVSDRVWGYTLSTAYDITTASLTDSLIVSSQEVTPTDVEFNDDGTLMYITGGDGQDITQYTLSTGFDLTTASFDTTFDVSAQEGGPGDLAFNNDGTKMFVVGSSGDEVNQYSLSTAYDIDTASFDSVTFSVNAQDATPMAIHFNTDGTKMFIAGGVNQSVYQYSLSTGFDLSTASYDSISFSTSSEETGPGGIAFNADGTKMFIVGGGSDTVYQYSTGTVFVPTSAYHPTVTKTSGQIDSSTWLDINTMTADETLNGGEVYYAVSTDDRTTWAVIDDTDGVRNIVRDNAGTWQYNTAVGTAGFGFSAASTGYDSVSLSVSSNSLTIWGIDFNSDGTKLYVVDDNNNQVDEYTLSTAYDISTGTYSATFSVGSQTDDPTALFFKPDGTKMFVGDRQNEFVREYTLSTAFDITTASHTGSDFGISSQETDIRGLTFNNDGTKMYLAGNTNDTVYQYTLSTAWDVSTASYDSVSLNVSSEASVAGALRFNTDGTKLFVQTLSTGTTPEDVVLEYNLTTPYDVSTGSYSGSFIDVGSESNVGTGMTFNSDGTKMYISDNSTNTIYQYTTLGAGYTTSETWVNATTNDELYALQEALEDQAVTFFDLANASYDSKSFSIASQETVPESIEFNADGTKMYIVGQVNDTAYQYSLSTAYDVSTASYDSVSFSFASQDQTVLGFTFNNDGTKLFIVGYDNLRVFQYSLSTAYDISTASYDSVSLLVSGQDNTPTGLTFNTDGTKMYVVGAGNDRVYQYSLSTGFDLSTASYDSVFLAFGATESAPGDLVFNNDGTKLYILGETTGDAIYQFSLSTAFDLSTASYDSVSFSFASQETQPRGLRFSNTGEKLFIVGLANDTVYQYTTASFANFNRMNSTQLNAVTDPNHYTLGDTLDLAIMLYTASAGSIPESDGVSINYDAEALNQGAVVGTDYDFDFPDSTTVRVTSNAAQNLKIRVV